jgi:hypothetical protein
MRFDRRVILFAVLSVVCFALTPVADAKYANIPPIVGATYAVLSVLFLLDWWSRAHETKRRPPD